MLRCCFAAFTASAAICFSSAGVSTMVGISKPAAFRKACSSAASTFARERSDVLNRTLPVLM